MASGQWPPISPHERATEWAHVPREHLELTCRTLDRLIGFRNRVIADLADHLTDEHRRLLAYPNLPADERAKLERI
jgi:hypothetical protein